MLEFSGLRYCARVWFQHYPARPRNQASAAEALELMEGEGAEKAAATDTAAQPDAAARRASVAGLRRTRHSRIFHLVSNLNRARVWLRAGNHIEPEE